MEEILSSKAEDRRSIFEEAAGVLKYKTRKKKAENKLFETQDNLNRVEDILHELEGQVEPLKIQASIAKDYLEKKKELEHVEIALTAYDIEELHGKWSTLKEKVQMAKEEELAESSAISAKEAKIEDTRDKIQALDESVDELQQVLLVTSEELEKLEGRKEVLKERKKNAVQNQEQLEEAIVQFQQKETVLKEELSKQEAVFETLQAEVKQLRAQVKEKQQALSLHNENVEEKIEQLKSDYFELLNTELRYATNSSFLMTRCPNPLSHCRDSRTTMKSTCRNGVIYLRVKPHVKRNLPELSRRFTVKSVHIVICRQNMSRKSVNTKK